MFDDDPTAPITEFRQEYRFLSNFWPCRVQYGTFWFPTVEHAYQAAKCSKPEDAAAIREASSAALAKRLGSRVVLRSGWENEKLGIMADLLWQKFVLNSELRARLVATGTRELVEGNTWGDTYWGRCGMVGSNHLGNLLMQMRAVGQYIVNNSK